MAVQPHISGDQLHRKATLHCTPLNCPATCPYLIKSIHKAYPFGAQLNSKPCEHNVTVTMEGQWFRATEQQYLLSKASVKQWLSVVTKWMGDCYVLGFAPALRFLQSNSMQNQILYRLYKHPSDDTINWGPMCIVKHRGHTHAKRSCTHVKDPGVHVKVQWIMETPK